MPSTGRRRQTGSPSQTGEGLEDHHALLGHPAARQLVPEVELGGVFPFFLGVEPLARVLRHPWLPQVQSPGRQVDLPQLAGRPRNPRRWVPCSHGALQLRLTVATAGEQLGLRSQPPLRAGLGQWGWAQRQAPSGVLSIVEVQGTSPQRHLQRLRRLAPHSIPVSQKNMRNCMRSG